MLEYRRQLLVSKIVLVHNREPKNLQRRLRNSLNNKRKYWRSLKIFHKGGKVGTKAWSLDGALEHVLSVVVWLILFVAAQIKSVPTRETGDGRGAGGSNPAQNPKKAFLPSEVNGIKSQVLLKTGAEVTIISEDLYYHV